MKFYYPDGQEIGDVKTFVEFYNRCYFQSTKPEVEEAVMKIMKKSRKSPDDIFKIIAWKTGKINMKQSGKERFEYHNGWDEKSLTAKFRKESKGFSDFVTTLSKIPDCQAKSFFEQLKTTSVPYGIGTVILITLLSFFTKMNYPIYDRFACVALSAILKDKKPWSEEEYKEISQKYKQDFKAVLGDEHYLSYIKNLQTVFGNTYKTNRDIDRALWAYGHLFEIV